MFEIIKHITTRIRTEKPVILNITNEVTVNFVANGLLSLGASPIMSNASEEAEDLVKLAQAVVINLGTLNNNFIRLCETICQIANQLNKPIILDPVGAGASHYRTETSKHLLSAYPIAIIRANASEVLALAGEKNTTKGVDNTINSDEAKSAAQKLSASYDIAVCMSGKTDIIVDNNRIKHITRGSALMPMVTGTGCLLSGVIGAFHAVNHDRFVASIAASFFYAVCGEIAAKEIKGPGSFQILFLDALNSYPVKIYFYEA